MSVPASALWPWEISRRARLGGCVRDVRERRLCLEVDSNSLIIAIIAAAPRGANSGRLQVIAQRGTVTSDLPFQYFHNWKSTPVWGSPCRAIAPIAATAEVRVTTPSETLLSSVAFGVRPGY